MNKIVGVIIVTLSLFQSIAQQGETIFGMQYKPIVPNRFIGEYEREYNDLPVFKATSTQVFGNSLGMIFRHYFQDNLAIETGINFTKRKFDLHFELDDSLVQAVGDTMVSFVNYQIPVSALVFVRLSDEVFMNASVGVNFDFYPTEIGTSKTIDINNQFIQRGYRTQWIQLGANANFGFEYRTRKAGALYLGASYNQPFGNTMRFTMAWTNSASSIAVRDYIKGGFLTIDFRYYLPVNKN